MTARPRVESAIPLVSPSQIKTYRRCARRWGWQYITKIRTPSSPAAELGTDVDDNQLQPYLRDGRPFDFTRISGEIANSLLEFLPRPATEGTPLEVQKHFILPSPAAKGEFGFQGYKDLVLPDSKWSPGLAGGAPYVGDFKTTSDFKWALTEETILEDEQAMVYAADAIFQTRSPIIDLDWMYARTRGARKSKRVHVRVTAEHVVGQFQQIEATAIEMFDARKNITDPLALPPSPEACADFGGCPFRDRCNLSPSEHVAGLEALAAKSDPLIQLKKKADVQSMSSTSSLLANLKAKKAGLAAAAAPAPAPTPAAQPSLEEHVAANPRASFLTQPMPPAGTLGINPPESRLPPPPPEALPEPPPVGEAATAPKKRITAKARAAQKAAETEPAAPAAATDPRQLSLPLDPPDAYDAGRTIVNVRDLADAIVDNLIARLKAVG
ncbi:AT hook motif domain protein [Labilithrix luteola]|uniref:AT hook motif domain protein n=1 Tax=Labilithrix luteola TaxID=1391654 RepID=A0A0K1PIP7_9BACT|nr:PD-(D/E)XK nuclease family protein [Labilithrix luteola]AKU93395.1 AT hook motif domain protein [Labilithrix luteola]